MNKTILVTGANSGIGKDVARQLALLNETEKVYLGCRNQTKAEAAKKELEAETARNIFEILLLDVSSPESVKQAVAQLKEPVDALIMNAGGMGGKSPFKMTSDGVTQIFASNVLGHVVLTEELIKAKKLNKVALYASSEAVRGIKKMGIKQPNLDSSSINEFKSIINGTYFNGKKDPMEAYAHTKYAATMWMSAMARKHPDIKFLSVSPGGTRGTAAMDDMPLPMKVMYKYIAMPILLPLVGMSHKLEDGAKRFVDSISNTSLKTGTFYGSKEKVLTGQLVEQSIIFPDLSNTAYQDNASEAIRSYLN